MMIMMVTICHDWFDGCDRYGRGRTGATTQKHGDCSESPKLVWVCGGCGARKSCGECVALLQDAFVG